MKLFKTLPHIRKVVTYSIAGMCKNRNILSQTSLKCQSLLSFLQSYLQQDPVKLTVQFSVMC
jgi:hypothetical protein